MVKPITILAIMAALATAAPVSNSTSKAFPIPSFGSASRYVSITATKGWSVGVASAIQACAIGVDSGCVDSGYKAALGAWISGAGAVFFDVATCHEIKTWCTDSSKSILGAWAQKTIEGALVAESYVSAAGGVITYFNGVIEDSFKGSSCACHALNAGETPRPQKPPPTTQNDHPVSPS